MPTPTGTISLSDVNTELGKAANAHITMNDANVRGLAGKPSGTITMADLRGKSSGPSVANPMSPVPKGLGGEDPMSGGGCTVEFNIYPQGTWETYVAYGRDHGSNSGRWLTGGNAGDVNVKVIPTHGSFSKGTVNTLMNMGSTRDFEVWDGRECIFTVEFYNAHTGALLSRTTGCHITSSM